MHEVQKQPKKPLYYYYGVALLILMCFNLLAMPYMAEKQVKNIDYGTFMTMTENKDIGRVEIQSNTRPARSTTPASSSACTTRARSSRGR